MPKVSEAGQSGYDRNQLSTEEQEMLQTTIDRSFVDIHTEQGNPLHGILEDNQDAIMFAAEVAKAQFDKEFDGLNPNPGFFGVDYIHPAYFGYNTWSNTPDGTGGGNVIDWLDDSAPDQFSGSGGRDNPLRIGENAVHVILAVGSYDGSPTCTRIQFFKDDSPRSAFSTQVEFRSTDLRVKRLNAPMVYAEDDDIYSQFTSADSTSEALYLYGLTFIPEKQSREMDPTNMEGENIITTP